MRTRFILAALLILAFTSVSLATSFVPPGSTTTWVTNGDSYSIGTNERFRIGGWDAVGAILNQVGGTITITGSWGSYGTAENPGGWGVYNMSSNAVFNAPNLSGSDSGAGAFWIDGYNGSKMTMADNAAANLRSLAFGSCAALN